MKGASWAANNADTAPGLCDRAAGQDKRTTGSGWEREKAKWTEEGGKRESSMLYRWLESVLFPSHFASSLLMHPYPAGSTSCFQLSAKPQSVPVLVIIKGQHRSHVSNLRPPPSHSSGIEACEMHNRLRSFRMTLVSAT